MEKEFRCDVSSLQAFVGNVLAAAGTPTADAEVATRHMVKAELWGVSTHGVSRLSRYVMRLRDGTVNPRPNIRISGKYAAALVADGDNGLGAVVMERALTAAMEHAAENGLCTVGVRASNHFGMAGYYSYIAAKKGFVSIGFTNSLAAMAPWGSNEACIGTNPIAFGFPRKDDMPIIADLATSLVARGKILLAAKMGKMIPSDWALDKDGRNTTDPNKAAHGLLLPLGGPKGYALALAADAMSGVLTGADFLSLAGAYLNGKTKAGIGHFYLVMRPDLFLSMADYDARIARFAAEITSRKMLDGIDRIYLPGEREQLLEQQRRREGIVLPQAVVVEMEKLAEEYHVPRL